MNKKRPDFKTFKKNALKNPELRKEYEALKPEFDLVREFIRARLRAEISQTDFDEQKTTPLNKQSPNKID